MADNSFDSLVSGISAAERQAMLDKMRDMAQYEGDSFTPLEVVPTEPEISLTEQLKRESFSVRFLIWLKSVFMSTSQEQLLNEIKVGMIARSLSRNYPGLIDHKKGLLLPLFYDRIFELKKVADFFRPYIASMEQSEGSFYVFLGSVIMPTVSQEMNENVDPFKNPIEPEVRLELRAELLRRMDDVFAGITPDLKSDMYEAVKSVEWMRRFVRLPFTRILNLFSEVTTEIHTCPFSQMEQELAAFARCLCNGFNLSDRVLEALYLFSIRNSKKKLSDSEEESNKSLIFMQKSRENISILKIFMANVPLISLCSVVYVDSSWRPEQFTGGEDWFIKFKNSWKKIFEQKWENWTVVCKKEMLRQSLHGHFGLDSFPKLKNRPWLLLKGSGIRFRYELTAGFMTWYFQEKFPTFELYIKNLMVEGTFKKKEHQVALTEAFNSFLQNAGAINAMNDRLKPSGDVGSLFNRLSSDGQWTLQEQTQIEQFMQSVTREFRSILNRFGDSNRTLEMMLSGILGMQQGKGLDTVTNFSQIMGRENTKFQKTIAEARQSLESSRSFIAELEIIDAPKVFEQEN